MHFYGVYISLAPGLICLSSEIGLLESFTYSSKTQVIFLALLQDNLSTLLSLPSSHEMKCFLFCLNTTRVAEVSVLTTMKLIILSLALLGSGLSPDQRYSTDSQWTLGHKWTTSKSAYEKLICHA